ncbi:hypothetical protein BRD00_01415 [Halobacteriales archaeon QS_8_69_26]|nr:MAG: hypothetical protein BRD00_01415 [Halobacteriales archaeon QS_8_69_26]
MAGESSRGGLTSRLPDLEGATLDGVITVLSVLMVAGLVADLRAHATGLSFEEEGFLTTAHVFFYAMFLGIVATLLVAVHRERRRGASLPEAVPAGYGWAVVGVAVFGTGGAADYVWHSAFGFEQGIEALVSPSHTMLAVGGALFLAAPLRAAWIREGRPAGAAVIPLVVSATLVLTLVGMFGGFLNPLVRPYPSVEGYQTMRHGMVTLIVFPLLYVGMGLALVRRFRPPPGCLTVVFTVPAVAISIAEFNFPLAYPALLTGIVADVLAATWPPTPDDPTAMRVFSAAVPMTLAGTYLVMVDLSYGLAHEQLASGFVTWSAHVLAGTVVLAGVAGLMLSYFAVPGMVDRE